MNRTRQTSISIALYRLPRSRRAFVQRGSRETAGAAAAVVAIRATYELQRGQAPTI